MTTSPPREKVLILCFQVHDHNVEMPSKYQDKRGSMYLRSVHRRPKVYLQTLTFSQVQTRHLLTAIKDYSGLADLMGGCEEAPEAHSAVFWMTQTGLKEANLMATGYSWYLH